MQKIDNSVPYRLIYSLGEHPYLGYLIEPHIVQLNSNGSDSLSYKRVFTNTVDEFKSALDEEDYKIIKLLDEIEQTHVIKRFHKKAIRPMDYFSKIFDQKIHHYIRPKLDQKMLKALELIGDKPLFLMSKKDGYPANQALKIADRPTSILFHFRRSEEETRYFPTLKYNGYRMEFMFKNAEVIINQQAWLLLENTLYYFDQPLEGKKLSPFLNKRYIAVGRTTEKKYFETFVTGLIEKYNVYAEGFDIKTVKEDAIPVLTLNYVEGGQSHLKLSFNYGDYSFSAGGEHKVSVRMQYEPQKDLYTFIRIKRSITWEEKQRELLNGFGLQKLDALFGSYVTEQGKSIFSWLNENQRALLEKGFIIQQETRDKTFFIGKSSIDIEVNEDNDWFDVRAFANFGPYKIPFIQLRDHILNRIQEFVLPNGEIAILPEEWFAQYEHLFHFSVKKDILQFNKAHIGLLYEISEHTALTISRKLQHLSSFEKIATIDPPHHFTGQLRPYQQAGYNWFHFLQEFKFGGVLADDMGLGKTVQTLAFLQKQKEDLKSTDHAKTSLLILPTSLVYNWQKEADRFAPEMRILLHTGSNRFKDPYAFSHFDLVITTYGIVRSDEVILGKFFFNYIILDESQNIKNPTSKSFKSIKTLKSRNKLALSGTPVENSVSDIWSQMHFTNPGLLGSYAFFQKEFVVPIEKKKDEEKAKRLQAIIKPFVLRRTKNQVATELPPKTEQIIYCEMTEKQSDKYETTKSEYRNALLEGVVQQGGKTSQITLLQGLTKLRQLANHPKMVDENFSENSGKFQAVLDMLESISSEQNKVLIFSQFVKHLQLFKTHFDKHKIKYAYLDGATKDRADAVQNFKEDKDTKIFLISIKAGGVGLNLTEADYVFILDPWWNPAVEQQAIDRTHRIGQTQNVFIYKFISKDTVEEKIVALQNRKKSIANSLITTEESFVKSLSKDDLKELLR
ncbi:DEAD/DEAH box helicase [Sphingobacterium pedocola]|uniref:Helicase SNF2 n=1 Tax=Sphingobacterium pedocola TaxID=2082722 RepID=A0ABR9T9R4_9SPHI|nr:DEAD/DEAH box helicase [Sphingobacterium pedocola]MBE8721752.1 helicase SNF2 [Sphingobacterium pedocola]